MKWIGQHIWDFISRFRNKVYFEDLETSTETTALVVDADGKVSKNSLSAGLPAGGDTGDSLLKASDTDYDFVWGMPVVNSVYFVVKNVSGVELQKGTPVHAVLDGTSGNVIPVIAADASIPSAMPCNLVLNETIADEAEGQALLIGYIKGVDTSLFSPGDVVYVASGGGYTNTKPTGTDLIQNLGIVVKSHASNGSGLVYGAGRSNDVPNLPTGKFFIGSATNTQESAYTLPTADGTNGQVLTTDGAGASSWQDAGGGGTDSVVIATTTTQARLNKNDNYYTGNDDYGWNYVIWVDPATFSTSFTDTYTNMGIIIPKDITTLEFLSTIERFNGNGTGITVELFTAPRPNGSTSNLNLTSIGSVSVDSTTTGRVNNGDISLTGLSISKGTLLFVAIKKTGGTNTTTYCKFNYTIIVS